MALRLDSQVTDDDRKYLPYAPGPDPGSGPRPLQDLLADLRRPIHPDITKTKERSNKKTGQSVTLSFIEWHTAVRILNKYCPGWTYEVDARLSADGQQVVVLARIGLP